MIDRKTTESALEEKLGALADKFTADLDAGEEPSVEDYARQNPELAEAILQLFPALQVMHPRSRSNPSRSEARKSVTLPEMKELGDYEILREIGRGGMGIVYEARQRALGRRVALKVLPYASVMDSRHLQRFKNEASAAAQLQHPHIVPVFSVGCENGIHHYVMQLIEGHALSAVVHNLGQVNRERRSNVASVNGSSERPSTLQLMSGAVEGSSQADTTGVAARLDTTSTNAMLRSLSFDGSTTSRSYFRAVANLGCQAADALQHAHERGVVHRDIKPANLLLDYQAHLWITDFGLASMQAGAGITAPGDLLGTVRYMSPEQALGGEPVDHRTDIYSLGVTLYELAVLRPAFASHDRRKVLRQIAFDEPPEPRCINHQIPKELETIIAKASAKTPSARYQTARELAEDLRRFLDDKPILAQPASVLQRMDKWARRHRSIVVISVMFLILAVIGLAVSTGVVLRQGKLAQEQRQQAEANLRIARNNVDRMLHWMQMQELEGVPYPPQIKQAALEESRSFFQKLLPEKYKDVETRGDAGAVYAQLGHVYGLLGQFAEAERSYDEAIRLFGSVLSELPQSTEYKARLANTYLDQATMRWEHKDYPQAEAAARQATAAYETLVGNTGESEYEAELSQGLNLLGLIMRDRGDVSEAAKTLRQAIARLDRLQARQPQEPQHQIELARVYRNLADVQLKVYELSQAADSARSAIAVQEKLVAFFPQRQMYVDELNRTRRWWSEVLAVEKPESAKPTSELAQLPGIPDSSSFPQYPGRLARARDTLNSALRRPSASPEGSEAYRQAVSAQQELIRVHPSESNYRYHLFEVHRDQGRAMLTEFYAPEAQKALGQALEIITDLLAESPSNLTYARQAKALLGDLAHLRERAPLADLMLMSRESADGLALAIERARDVDPTPFEHHAHLLVSWAEFFLLGNDIERALELTQQAMQLGEVEPWMYQFLGVVQFTAGRREEAMAAFAATLDPAATVDTLPDQPGFWTSAYFLDRITQDEYTSHWQGRTMCAGYIADLPWFYVGLRMEMDGKPEEAKAAYLQCASLGQLPYAYPIGTWAAYRLENLRVTSP